MLLNDRNDDDYEIYFYDIIDKVWSHVEDQT